MSIKLSDISSIKLGYSFREAIVPEVNGNISIITAKSINDGILDLDSSIKIKGRHFKQDHLLEMNDIIINTRLNFKAAIYNSSEKSIVASPLIRVRVTNPEKVLPEYLNIFLNSDRTQKQLHTLADTGSVPFISLSQIKNLNIVIPSIEKQKKITQFHFLAQREQQIYNKIIFMKSKIRNKVLDDLVYG